MRMTLLIFAMTSLMWSACENQQESSETMSSADTAGAQAPEFTPAAVPVPSFQLVNAAGEQINLQQYKGKKLFVNFWASWCPPCKREMPSIQKLYDAMSGGNTEFLLVSLDDSFDKAKNYMASQKYSMPVYYPAGNLPPLFNVESIPTTFVFDEQGKLMKTINGSDNYDTPAYKKLLK